MMDQWKIHPEVRTTPNDEDGSVLINLESGKVFSLNGVGAKVWTMLEQGLTFKSVIDVITQEYEVSPQQLKEDVETFIHELEGKGLLQARSASTFTKTAEKRNGIAA